MLTGKDDVEPRWIFRSDPISNNNISRCLSDTGQQLPCREYVVLNNDDFLASLSMHYRDERLGDDNSFTQGDLMVT